MKHYPILNDRLAFLPNFFNIPYAVHSSNLPQEEITQEMHYLCGANIENLTGKARCSIGTVPSYDFEPIQVETGRMNWTYIPKYSSMEPIYSPKSPTEVRKLSLKYQLEYSIYTDYIRLNETIFYRNV